MKQSSLEWYNSDTTCDINPTSVSKGWETQEEWDALITYKEYLQRCEKCETLPFNTLEHESPYKNTTVDIGCCIM